MRAVTDLVGAVAVPLAVVLGAATAAGLVLMAAGARPRTGSGPANGRPRRVFGRLPGPAAWRGPRLVVAVLAGVVEVSP